jgi:anti-sigma factor RsiW
MTADELTCQELVELVTDYLDGAMPADDVRRFDAHLTFCDGCTTYLDQFRQTIDLAGRLTPDAVDPDTEAVLLDTFRDWKRSGQ